MLDVRQFGHKSNMTGNLGPWSRHPAWGHTVTTMATIPATLTVLRVSAMYRSHCVHHLPVALCPPRRPHPPWFPMCTLPSANPSQSPSSLSTMSHIAAFPTVHAMFALLTISGHRAYLTKLPHLALLAVPKVSRSLYLLCMLCGAPAQEASPLALQTEGMCLPGN